MTPHRAAPRRAAQNSPATGAATGASAPPRIALIAAVAANGVIGAGNKLPWRLPEDLKRFRALTLGHAVIMGRKTWESLPRALPGRQNIVVTRQHGYAAAGADTASSFAAALGCVRLPEPVFCIGGGEIYRAALPFATTLHLTEIAREFRRRRAVSAVRPQRLAGDRARSPPAGPAGRIRLRVRHLRARISRGLTPGRGNVSATSACAVRAARRVPSAAACR